MICLPESAELLFAGASGVYIPQRFASEVIREYVHGVSSEDWAILEAGPEHDHYWDTWADVLDSAELWVPVQFTENTVKVHHLYQDGDLWIIPEDAEWPEE